MSYLSRALQGDGRPTVRSLIVLLIGLIVVGALLTSPFGLKRMLFNLYPWTKERLRLDRGQEPRLQGRRNLRPGRGHLQRGRHPASTGGDGTRCSKPSCSRSFWYLGFAWRL